LFVLRGAEFRDPNRLLQGSGKKVRHIVLTIAEDLYSAGIRGLIAETLGCAAPQAAATPRQRTVIKSVSAKRRTRRPSPGRTGGRRKEKHDG